ncbi:uncharacterized protein LOC103713978 isoform X2 [Phoenix dactylifera]|uniref:Uncharacterized protein LOC103713978 isoform X2 n=1 Tax=Phoenix dactylifera TaxID=42345 RepID=A0A8B7CH92_PHODC|nr:uncharacterized protein LOC103713978 isoform X2 [Phoenix dactylifera]
MVCMTGCGRMAAMVRLLTVGSCPEITPEEDSYEKIAAQSIHKEFHDADEANLLEEEDMHVFDCRPLTDPLHLVCCNACKKPVKASQYAAHAERCRSLNSVKDIVLELDGSAGHKKPPRKGRKILQATNCNQRKTVEEQEKSESMDGNVVGVSESNFDNQSGMLSSQSGESQRTPASVDHTTVLDASEIGTGGREYYKISNAEREVPCNTLNRYQKAGQILENGVIHKEYLRSNAPVPLATKIYHLQGNNHLRLELGHLYREACAEQHGADSLSPESMQDKGMMSIEVSSSSKLFREVHRDDVPQTKVLAQSSELFLGNSGALPSAASFPNHFRGNRFSKPEVAAASVGVMKDRFHSAPYSYTAKSGLPLGTMQKTNGRVSVV